MASLLVNNSQNEIVTMTGRGASKFQIIFTFAVQILILALIAGLLLGPLLTRLGLTLWGLISGDAIPGQLPTETWSMSLIAAGIGWLAIVLGIISATRSSILEWEKSITRPGQATGWQKSYLDIFLLVIGILLYWQLSTSGSFVMTRLQGTKFADPLLLIGPTVLLIALALIYMRLFPIMIRTLASIAKTSRGVVLPLGLTRIARYPQRLSWIILLISLTAALTLFARIYSDALFGTQEQIAKYQAGSDLRLDLNKISLIDLERITEIVSTSLVQRGIVQDNTGRGFPILAVDPDSFVNVSQYPEGMTNLTMEIIMQALRAPDFSQTKDSSSTSGNPYTDQRDSTEPIPAIFSYSTIPNDGKIGDHRDLIMAGQPLTFEVRGIIADFPTLTSDFIIVNSGTFESIAGSSITAQLNKSEAWLNLEESGHDKVASQPYLGDAVLADSQQVLNIIRNNILTLGTVRAFGLNAFVLATISLAGLILANYFSFRQRAHEFGILRALGLSHSQSNQLLIGEGILVLVLGLISGGILGYGLTKFMRPYISLAVSRTLPGMIVHQINVNWESVATVSTLMILLYGFATAIIVLALWRSDAHQILRIGDE
jgi:putative ABC transport system permease protein